MKKNTQTKANKGSFLQSEARAWGGGNFGPVQMFYRIEKSK